MPDRTLRRVVIAGASIAGFSAAATLRDGGFDGEIHLVGDEPVRTYERPPLSKGVLTGDDEPSSTAWSRAVDDDLGIEWMLGERATGLDLDGRHVVLATGERLDYDGLVIATGASPRRLPDQPDLAGIHVLRTLDDAVGLRSDLTERTGGEGQPDQGSRVVVVGAGFIGAEVAASCRAMGCEVTIVEPLEQPLARVLGERLGAVVADLHRDHGVRLRLGVGVERVEGDDRVERVRLSDGTTVEADVVVVGIGVTPNIEWLEGSGLALADGVVCDATTLAAPGVTAAGDVASWDSPRYGRIRIEHWDHAVQMGEAAGRRLLAGDTAEPFDPVPWFWSDQYDVRLQLAGRAVGEMAITDGSIDEGRFVALFGQDGQVQGALGWNWPAKTVRYRMALEAGLSWDDALG